MTLSARNAARLSYALVAWHRLALTIRFVGRQVRIHPTSWVSAKSVIRTIGGGTITIGRHCNIHPFAMLMTHGGDIRVGDHCSVNPFTLVYGCGGVTIGDGVRIAAHVVIIPENHNRGTDSLPLYRSGTTRKGIKIEDNVWVGAGVKILDGVTIGRNCVIAAGAVVNRSLPANVIAAGVPARIVKMTSSERVRPDG